MTASSSENHPLERALDAMVLVYALLEGHPASAESEKFIRDRSGWFTTALTILEVKSVLTKVYGVAPTQATQKLTRAAAGPLIVLPVEAPVVMAAMATADHLKLDLTDAVLLEMTVERQARSLATEDVRLAEACKRLGITAEVPFDDTLRRVIADWESSHLPTKGLARVLGRIQSWLQERDLAIAESFRSLTGGHSHLP